jgi:hypothetical protein
VTSASEVDGFFQRLSAMSAREADGFLFVTVGHCNTAAQEEETSSGDRHHTTVFPGRQEASFLPEAQQYKCGHGG